MIRTWILTLDAVYVFLPSVRQTETHLFRMDRVNDKIPNRP